MIKLNCWEYKKCGREPDGDKVKELGVCPASTESRTNGLNCGKNGGRVCWAINETLCENEKQGVYFLKLAKCLKCKFHKLVINEECDKFVQIEEVLLRFKE
jgi:hypothetical protein